MPLNFKENENQENEARAERTPILHQPGQRKKISRKLAIVVIVLCCILLAGVWGYKSGLLKKLTQPSRDVSADQRPTSSEGSAVKGVVPDTMSASLREEKASPAKQPLAAALVPSPGNYTIYIGRHRTRSIADEEAMRWTDAGYQSFVTVADGWYRVSIGVFERKTDAIPVIEKLSDGFEGGYWVSALP